MKLDFDLGNTRLKWHLYSDAFSEYGAAPWKDLEASSRSIQKIQSLLQTHNADGIEGVDVCISSVAGPKTEELFNLWLREKLNVQANYLKVEKHFAGLTVAYNDVSKLGVDRWLAMLAAIQFPRANKIVIDAGSAITVDYVNEDNVHEGGLIVPGLPLVCEAMSRGTHNLKPEALTLPQNWQPGCDTVSGIAQGLGAMYKGLVNEALDSYIKKAQTQSQTVQVYLGGGDAPMLASWCEARLPLHQIHHCKFLVLDGIEVWRRQSRRY